MRLGVFGAGAIGAFLGGRLLLAGHDVVMLGRRGGALLERGLTLTDYSGARWQVPAERIFYTADPQALASCDVVLVTVKSAATPEAGASLARVLSPKTVVVSFQNGVSNPGALRAVLGPNRVLAGMVPFNVLWRDEAHLHYLNGELIRLGEKHGVPTPVNGRLVELIRAAEAAGRGPRASAPRSCSRRETSKVQGCLAPRSLGALAVGQERSATATLAPEPAALRAATIMQAIARSENGLADVLRLAELPRPVPGSVDRTAR